MDPTMTTTTDELDATPSHARFVHRCVRFLKAAGWSREDARALLLTAAGEAAAAHPHAERQRFVAWHESRMDGWYDDALADEN